MSAVHEPNLVALTAARGVVVRATRELAEEAMAAHDPCADCVRCATCRREWCPTVTDRCTADYPSFVHVTGAPGTRDDEYCYRCQVCPGGYFQFHDPAYPNCTEAPHAPHVVADGKGSE